MDTVYMPELPLCDICVSEKRFEPSKAKYDVATRWGPFAYLCNEHYEAHGTSVGSKLALITEKKPKRKFKKTPTVFLPLTTRSVISVKCPHCDHKHRVEPDADYTKECEACGNKFKLVPAI